MTRGRYWWLSGVTVDGRTVDRYLGAVPEIGGHDAIFYDSAVDGELKYLSLYVLSVEVNPLLQEDGLFSVPDGGVSELVDEVPREPVNSSPMFSDGLVSVKDFTPLSVLERIQETSAIGSFQSLALVDDWVGFSPDSSVDYNDVSCRGYCTVGDILELYIL